MKNVFRTIVLILALAAASQNLRAQSCVVIMNQNYVCEDPRDFSGEQTWTLKKGEALRVYKEDDYYEYFGPYLAASVEIPLSKCHIVGTVKGERCVTINVANLPLREKPQANAAIFCYDEDYAGSIDPSKFLVNYRRVKGVYGTSYSWKPYYFNKGTRVPYNGKVGNYYKTMIDGIVFYLDASKCTLR